MVGDTVFNLLHYDTDYFVFHTLKKRIHTLNTPFLPISCHLQFHSRSFSPSNSSHHPIHRYVPSCYSIWQAVTWPAVKRQAVTRPAVMLQDVPDVQDVPQDVPDVQEV